MRVEVDSLPEGVAFTNQPYCNCVFVRQCGVDKYVRVRLVRRCDDQCIYDYDALYKDTIVEYDPLAAELEAAFK